jgi:hypothetical protein
MVDAVTMDLPMLTGWLGPKAVQFADKGMNFFWIKLLKPCRNFSLSGNN